jgi:hypothetical protein
LAIFLSFFLLRFALFRFVSYIIFAWKWAFCYFAKNCKTNPFFAILLPLYLHIYALHYSETVLRDLSCFILVTLETELWFTSIHGGTVSLKNSINFADDIVISWVDWATFVLRCPMWFETLPWFSFQRSIFGMPHHNVVIFGFSSQNWPIFWH